jgi:hypothetical protein
MIRNACNRSVADDPCRSQLCCMDLRLVYDPAHPPAHLTPSLGMHATCREPEGSGAAGTEAGAWNGADIP